MRLDNAQGRRQPQAHAGDFGGEVRFKDLVKRRLIHADAGIGDRKAGIVTGRQVGRGTLAWQRQDRNVLGCNRDLPFVFATLFDNRLKGIEQKIQHYPLHQGGAHGGGGQAREEAQFDGYHWVKPWCQRVHTFAYQLVEANRQRLLVAFFRHHL